ncbi:MAG TPA: phosphoribosylamine--glycine ligase [Pyrinomonadaceae bacterium]
MKVLVIGSGGREHAICQAFSRSPLVSRLYCAPGNAGIAAIAECVPIKAEDVASLVQYAVDREIDLTFVGGEGPLARGVVDEFEGRGLKIVGASKAAARLESSKAFAKDFMSRHAVPTARYFTADSPAEAIETLGSGHFGDALAPVVVKADGLAAGKGVVVARNRDEAISACGELAEMVGIDAAERIVLEEFLDGREVSLLMFADGHDFALMPPVRDHKRIGEGDTGPNTGGMGTITDAGLLTPAQTQTVIKDIIEPTLAGCIEEGFPFRGILFLGLMMIGESGSPLVRKDAEQETYITATPKVLEYNVRFGDPETQSILVRLESDLAAICTAMLEGKLAATPIKWHDGNSACVVLAAEGYPQRPRTGDVIQGLEEAAKMDDVTIFHAGTTLEADERGRMTDEKVSSVDSGRAHDSSAIRSHGSSFLTAGGRVLGVTATGDTLDRALKTAYSAVEKISWPGMQYRRDIGK